ncbi:hypothetical protein [Viridibacillus arvi]|uniref:hypothetical protein n=1 Tax=Viridibacillus arvi TaxID=263475 RepID=UPI0034CEA91B
MTEESVRKVFKLIEPFLPLHTVVEFEEFIESYIQLKDMDKYNLSCIKLQRETLESFRKKLQISEDEVHALKGQLTLLENENDVLLAQKYNEKMKFESLRKEMKKLEKENEGLQLLLKSEVEKNYQLVGSIEKVAEEQRKVVEVVKDLKLQVKQGVATNNEQITAITVLNEQLQRNQREKNLLEKDNDLLLSEVNGMKEKLVYEFDKGYKTALYQVRRKR